MSKQKKKILLSTAERKARDRWFDGFFEGRKEGKQQYREELLEFLDIGSLVKDAITEHEDSYHKCGCNQD